MKIFETLKRLVAPEIICPGASPSQITDFLKRNTLIGGRVVLDGPERLAQINGVTSLFCDMVISRSSVRGVHSLGIGSRIDIGSGED